MSGKLFIYQTLKNAEGSLEQDESDEQYVRLVQIGNNSQLKLTLDPEMESCHAHSALYVRATPTCPLYWVK